DGRVYFEEGDYREVVEPEGLIYTCRFGSPGWIEPYAPHVPVPLEGARAGRPRTLRAACDRRSRGPRPGDARRGTGRRLRPSGRPRRPPAGLARVPGRARGALRPERGDSRGPAARRHARRRS